MASRIVSRLGPSVRAARNSVLLTRTYATTSTGTRTTATARRTATQTSAAKATSTVGKGNPEIVASLPSTADEIDIPPEAFSAQPESVPSSSVLRQVESSVPSTSSASFTPVEFAESAIINGSPLDPSAPDWSKSYFGLSTQPFPKEAAEILLAPVDPMDVEIKPGALHSYCCLNSAN